MGEGVNLMDVEELGPALRRQQAKSSALVPEVRDMITPALRQALTKQGYKLLGTHSGVKMCRWTKVVFFHVSSKIKCLRVIIVTRKKMFLDVAHFYISF